MNLKKHRKALMTTLVVTVLLLSVLLNLGLQYLFGEGLWYVDTTPEGLYTPSQVLLDTCKQLNGEITITFCMESDLLLANYESRYVYYLAKQLSNRFDNIKIVCVDVLDNPTAVDPYRATTATRIDPDDVIVSCGGRYRIYSATSFWTLGENAKDETDYYSFNGEYKLATAFLAITSIVEPVVCFAYGHGESIYVPEGHAREGELAAYSNPDKSTFWGLMQEEGLCVEYINLDTEDIPEDCVMVVLDGPTRDYALAGTNVFGGTDALTRLHRFLADEQGALMVFKDPDYSLPNLEDFVADWGIGFENHILLQDMKSSLTDGGEVSDDHRYEKLIVRLTQDNKSVANAIYGDIAALGTAPRTIVERAGTVYKTWLNDGVGSSTVSNLIPAYFDFFMTSEQARRVTTDGRLDSLEQKVETPAAISMRIQYDKQTNDYYYSYCFGAATTSLTDNTYLDNRAYSNYDILFALVRYISRTDEYASLALGGTSLNSDKLGGKPLLTDVLDPAGNVRYDENRVVVEQYMPLNTSASVAWTITLICIPVLLTTGAAIYVLSRRRNR